MCAALLLVSRFCHVFVRSTAVARDGKQRTFLSLQHENPFEISKNGVTGRERESGLGRCEDKTVFAVILRCVAPI